MLSNIGMVICIIILLAILFRRITIIGAI